MVIGPLKPQWFQILLAVADGDRHGLAVMNEVLDRTEGQMRLWPAMLYRSLKRLTQMGLLEEREAPTASGDGDRRRFYGITPAGRKVLSAELTRLAGYIRAAEEKMVVFDRK